MNEILHRSISGTVAALRAAFMLIRNFQPGDQVAARELILSGLGGYFGEIDYALNADLDDIGRSYLQKGHFFVVAEVGEQLVATGGVLVNPDGSGQMVRVSVREGWRRRAVGTAVVRHLLAACRQHNLYMLTVETNAEWLAALSFYRSCGFIEFARDTESVYLSIIL